MKEEVEIDRHLRILLYGFWLNRNFGGPSVFHGLEAALAELYPGHELLVYQPSPVDPVSVSDVNFTVKEFPYRRRPFKLYRDWLLLKLFGRRSKSRACAAFWEDFAVADAVAFAYPICFCSKIKTATGVVSRWGALLAFFRTFGLSLLARLSGKVSVKTTASFGPTENAGNRLLARLACRFAFTRIVAREEECRRELTEVAGVKREVRVAPDLANVWHSGRVSCESDLLGFSVSYQLREQWAKRGRDYIALVARLVEHAAGKYGCRILLIPNQYESSKAGRTDIDVANEIVAAVPGVSGISVFDCTANSPSALHDAIAGCSAMVTARYHSCVAGFVSGVPQLILGWHCKYMELAKLYGQESRVLSDDCCTLDRLLSELDALWATRVEARAKILSVAPRVKALVLDSVRYLFDAARESRATAVSVIVPVYNAEREIGRCLDSLLAQSLRQIEVICVDDGSTDSSFAILQKYVAKDPRVKVFRQENLGAGVARNRGIEAATGEYLFFMDADDACDKTMLEKMFRKARKTGADTVITHKIFIDPATLRPSKIRAKPFPQDLARIDGAISPRDIADRLFTVAKSVPWDKLFRRGLVLGNGLRFQDTKRSNDIYFTDMALALSGKLAFVPESLYRYTYRRGGSLTKLKDAHPLDPLTAYDALERTLREKGLWDVYAKTFGDAYAGSALANLREFRERDNFDRFREITLAKLADLGRADLLLRLKVVEFGRSGTPPSVSVVMPVYNVEKYLRRSLDSILSQTLRDIEVVCVDDGSTDGSHAILEEYAAKDSRVKVIRQANAGAGAARNAGISAARGEYLFFFDADDGCDRKMLEVMVRKAKRMHADVVVAGKKIRDAETGAIIRDEPLPRSLAWFTRQPFAPQKIADRLFSFAKAVPWDKLFRRAFIEDHGLRFQRLPRSNDVYFVDMALALAKRIALLRKGYYCYSHRRGGGLTFGKDKWPTATTEAYVEIERSLRERRLWDVFRCSLAEVFFRLVASQCSSFRDKAAFEQFYRGARAKIMEYSRFIALAPRKDMPARQKRHAKLLIENESPEALWQDLERIHERESGSKAHSKGQV